MKKIKFIFNAILRFFNECFNLIKAFFKSVCDFKDRKVSYLNQKLLDFLFDIYIEHSNIEFLAAKISQLECCSSLSSLLCVLFSPWKWEEVYEELEWLCAEHVYWKERLEANRSKVANISRKAKELRDRYNFAKLYVNLQLFLWMRTLLLKIMALCEAIEDIHAKILLAISCCIRYLYLKIISLCEAIKNIYAKIVFVISSWINYLYLKIVSLYEAIKGIPAKMSAFLYSQMAVTPELERWISAKIDAKAHMYHKWVIHFRGRCATFKKKFWAASNWLSRYKLFKDFIKLLFEDLIHFQFCWGNSFYGVVVERRYIPMPRLQPLGLRIVAIILVGVCIYLIYMLCPWATSFASSFVSRFISFVTVLA